LVYLLECRDRTLYCGITNDLARRLKAHSRGEVKYTRGRLPVEVVYSESARDRSAALKREAAWKRLSRAQKLKRIAVAAVALSGCDPQGPSKFSEINQQIIQSSCASASVCHSTQGASEANGLNMSQDPYAMLVNAPAVNAQAASEGRVRVKPGDPDNSFMWIKLNLKHESGYGLPMPSAGNPPLPTDQLAGIRAWIAKGAPND
jgi:putative endonuclease